MKIAIQFTNAYHKNKRFQLIVEYYLFSITQPALGLVLRASAS